MKPIVGSGEAGEEATAAGRAWPAWARMLVSLVLVYHMVAVVAIDVGSRDWPSSMLEQRVADWFGHYYEALDQGFSYHYYAPEPSPTPIVTATLQFADGHEETVRLPRRGTWPRLRYQRQLALAYHLFSEFRALREAPPEHGPTEAFWARSYARHLCQTTGCRRVKLFAFVHKIPEPGEILQERARTRGRSPNIDAEEFYTQPELVGEYSCEAF